MKQNAQKMQQSGRFWEDVEMVSSHLLEYDDEATNSRITVNMVGSLCCSCSIV
jgi:hypothetical protein